MTPWELGIALGVVFFAFRPWLYAGGFPEGIQED
jgi:hypothetical protein